MSALRDAAPRRHLRADGRPVGPLAAVALLLALLTVGVASADRPAGAMHISAVEAARSGSLIAMLRDAVGSTSLLEVRAPGGEVLLAVSADGGQAALAAQAGQTSGSLTLAHTDGSQLRVPLPGLLSAGFAADGSWLAVVDGHGALWRVNATTGDAAPINDGPFLGSPIVTADGSLLLLSVSSVEAPFRSQVVRVAATGAVTPLSGDGLAYAGYPLADGGVAVVAHEPGGTTVRRVEAGASRLITDLEPGAINVVVASDGQRIAYEVAGRGIFLLDRPGASPRSLGAGSRPCFAADAVSLLVRRDNGSAALALDGAVLAVTQQPAGFAGAAGCLP